jgi:hypothetical protein
MTYIWNQSIKKHDKKNLLYTLPIPSFAMNFFFNNELTQWNSNEDQQK